MKCIEWLCSFNWFISFWEWLKGLDTYECFSFGIIIGACFCYCYFLLVNFIIELKEKKRHPSLPTYEEIDYSKMPMILEQATDNGNGNIAYCNDFNIEVDGSKKKIKVITLVE